MARGRPFEPGNKFGRGRPRGSRNKNNLSAQMLLENHAEPLMRKVLTMAFQGNLKALQLCMNRIPASGDLPVKLGSLPTGTAAEVSKSAEKVVRMIAAAKLSIGQGLAMLEVLDKRRHAIETEDLGERVQKLEVSHEPEYQSQN